MELRPNQQQAWLTPRDSSWLDRLTVLLRIFNMTCLTLSMYQHISTTLHLSMLLLFEWTCCR
eukprot:COSAG01_NODE_794_length_13545_cov_7.323070_7_plen_62_part_00